MDKEKKIFLFSNFEHSYSISRRNKIRGYVGNEDEILENFKTQNKSKFNLNFESKMLIKLN